jgi:hypothetical protein
MPKWTPPDGLGCSLPRPVSLTWRGNTLIALILVFVIGAPVLGIYLSGAGRRQTEEQRRLRDEGRPADATVTRAWIATTKDRRHWIAYRFEYGGRIYTHSVLASTKIWQNFPKGSTIAVRFVPSQPTISHPIAWDARPLPLWLAYSITSIVAAPALLLPIPLRRQIRLLAEGQPAPARVTRVNRTNTAILVRYEFSLPSSAMVQGRANASKPPADGAPLCVLYDPENPRRNTIYPLSLVRLESAASPPRQIP